MLGTILRFSLRHRFLVLALTVFVIAMGVVSAGRLPFDAIPDVMNVQVQVLTNATALGPLEVEQLVTMPIESAMRGIPRVEAVRSISKFGLSVVSVVFEEGTDIYWARTQVNERLSQVRGEVPAELGRPELAPISSGLSEIFQFEVRADSAHPRTLMELRTILDWNIAKHLRGVPGVVDINAYGGELKSYEVQVDPDRLIQYGVSLNRVFEALRRNNTNAGGGVIVHHGEGWIVRGEGLLENLDQIGHVVVDSHDSVPVYVRDLGRVAQAPVLRHGACTRDGRGEMVAATVLMLMGENSRAVVQRVKDELARIAASLPPGVTVEPIYDRSTMINATLRTVFENLGVGGILVIAVLFLMLGDVRAGLIVALAIPLAMLWAVNLMLAAGVPGSLMSLGALDFGLIVDSSVILVENCVRRLQAAPAGRSIRKVVYDAALDVRKPTMFGELIIAVVYLPILALRGTEGKLFHPMALTVIFALSGSLVLSLTLIPVLASLMLHRGDADAEHEMVLVRWAKKLYAPALDWTLRHPVPTLGGALILVAASVPVGLHLGAEFIPQLDEGDVLIESVRLPSSALETSLAGGTQVERMIGQFPEVKTVFCKTGRPEIAVDPMSENETDVWVMLKPPRQWTTGRTKAQLIAAWRERLEREILGARFNFTQPIQMRVNEMMSGVKGDVGISLYGDDFATLQAKGREVVQVVSRIPGARDVRAEEQEGLPMLEVKVRRAALARRGINAADVLAAVAAMGGAPVGQVHEGQWRFLLQVRLAASWRADLDRVRRIPIADPQGRQVPLGELADLSVETGPAEIERDQMQRRQLIEANVHGRDMAGFVAEAQRAVARRVKLPPNYTLSWGGQFAHLQSASRRLAVVVPLALGLIFILLYTTFGSVRLALLIFGSVPVAALGGVFALAIRGLPFSISAGVGFIALSGVAVLNGLVLVSAMEHLRQDGLSPLESARQAGLSRLRPVLMTALVASLGFLPMAVSTRLGAEVQKPLATVVIGGLISSTVLVLLVLPSLSRWLAPAESPAE